MGRSGGERHRERYVKRSSIQMTMMGRLEPGAKGLLWSPVWVQSPKHWDHLLVFFTRQDMYVLSMCEKWSPSFS